MSEKEEVRTLTTEDARQMLEEERNERLQMCNAAIARVLQEYGCQLNAVPQLTEDGKIGAVVRLVIAP